MGLNTVAPDALSLWTKRIIMLQRLRLAAFAAAFAFPALAQTPAAKMPAAVIAPAPAVVKPVVPAVPSPTMPSAARPVAPTTPSPGTASASATGKVNINSASTEQLDTLYGIGAPRAKKIIDGRPYTSLQDLVTKSVLTKPVFDGAKDRMALANINTSSATDLARTLPGVGDARAAKIVAGRPYASPADLVTKGVLTQSQFDAVSGLIAN